MRKPFDLYNLLVEIAILDVYIERATQFSSARKLIYADEEYVAALALLAVHSAISWNDAILIMLSGKRHRSMSHNAAVKATRTECNARGLSIAGIKHLQRLLKDKTKVSYSDEVTTYEVAQDMSIASERFEEWALQLLRETRKR